MQGSRKDRDLKVSMKNMAVLAAITNNSGTSGNVREKNQAHRGEKMPKLTAGHPIERASAFS